MPQRCANSAGYYNVLRSGGNVVGYTMALSADAASKLGYALSYDNTGTTTVTPKGAHGGHQRRCQVCRPGRQHRLCRGHHFRLRAR